MHIEWAFAVYTLIWKPLILNPKTVWFLKLKIMGLIVTWDLRIDTIDFELFLIIFVILLQFLRDFKFAWYFTSITLFIKGGRTWREKGFLAELRISHFFPSFTLLQLFLQLQFHFIFYPFYEFLIIILIFFFINRLLKYLFFNLFFIFLDLYKLFYFLRMSLLY